MSAAPSHFKQARTAALQGEGTPVSALRWAVLLAAGLLLAGAPLRAHQDADPHAYQRLEVDEPAPAFKLINQHAKPMALADFRGKVLVVTFLFTQCTDVCPVLPQMLARVDERLSEAQRAKLHFIGISVDAAHDTPERLRSFIQQRSLSDQRWTLLTGSLAALSKTAADYGVVVRPYPRAGFVHNTVFVVIDAKGRERVEFHGLATPTDDIARAVRGLIDEAARPARKR